MRLVLTGEGWEWVSGCSRAWGPPQASAEVGVQHGCSDAEQLPWAWWASGSSHLTGRPREVVTPLLHHPVTLPGGGCLAGAAAGRRASSGWAACGSPAGRATRAALGMPRSPGQGAPQQPRGKQPVEIRSWPFLLMFPHTSLCINTQVPGLGAIATHTQGSGCWF